MAAQTNSVSKMGRLLFFVGAVGVALPMILFGFLLSKNLLDASLGRLLATATEWQADLWLLMQVGIGLTAIGGGLLLLAAGLLVLRLSGPRVNEKEIVSLRRGRLA